MDIPAVDVRYSTATRNIIALQGFLDEYLSVHSIARTSAYIYQIAWDMWDSQTSVWTHNNGMPGYTQSNGVSGPGRCPVSSGGPLDIQDPNGNGVPLQPNPLPGDWWEEAPQWNGPMPISAVPSPTILESDIGGPPPNYQYAEHEVDTVSNPTPSGGIYDTSKADFLSRIWTTNWSDPPFQITWDDAPGNNGSPGHVGGLVPSNYTGSKIVSAYGGAIPSPAVFPANNPNSGLVQACSSGWSSSGGGFQLFRGQIRYTGPALMPYWIGRLTDGADFSDLNPGTWYRTVQFVSIGFAQGPFIMEAPFPTTNPASYSPVNTDCFFIVVGMDPSTADGTFQAYGTNFRVGTYTH